MACGAMRRAGLAGDVKPQAVIAGFRSTSRFVIT
ncbi:hypothetical protein LMG29542_01907 [Paraburkholderia humisilvae]|uniref:Uncharacterized protein n=1 Tax=Paraburkholderia humisilvae TaxID=627669 RepID=A0A6J5DHD2_9BURK|nr:hypothetical protein LMG29542_01907 [Paraburkholderia humisilvae]